MEDAMRILPPLLFGLACAAAVPTLPAQDKDKDKDKDKAVTRYGIELDPKRYPQKTPKEALKSVLTALEGGRLPYLVAHLADPRYVDGRVREHKAGLKGPDEARDLVAFDKVVKEIAAHLRDDPNLVRDLQQIARDGEWKEEDTRTAGWPKGRPGRKAFFRQVQGRWYLENKQQ
jgi:hypothetical protein